ncbi:hypothetical protein LCGC14_2496080 [marine sediment metagenome]|uniref:UDP-3-O-acyl-N-acetylglucosamine deacetylase n=1 Tax=marine sediment metagenome TaxID=412755 RepID=A0A0F9DX21_9ZZZZ
MYDMRLQRTIKKELAFSGVGLHTGREVNMRLKPAPRDSGIVFMRTDKGVNINASVTEVSDTAFATTLGNGKGKIRTVEHLLAATSGLGIDNLHVEIDGPEVPILDGSAVGFVRALKDCGLARQASNRPYLRITKPVVFREGQIEIAVMPYEGRRISYQIDFDHSMLGRQQMDIEVDETTFATEIAPARTFGFLKDVEYLQSMGLAKGGSLDNAILLDDKGVVNSTGLRFEDEFIRHKVLDFIGDTSLAGFPIYGHFIVSRSGHSTNVKFLKHLLSSPDCWELVTEVSQTLPASA